jgi:hypothetical protein
MASAGDEAEAEDAAEMPTADVTMTSKPTTAAE